MIHRVDPAARPAPLRLRDLAVGERPQERLERFGASALSDTELLAMLLRSGSREMDVLALASRLIAEAGSLGGLIGWSEADFRRLKGVGRIKALQLVTVMEIARRALGSEQRGAPVLNRPELIFAYFQPVVSGLAVEKLWVLCLNRKNRLIKRVEVTSGTATGSLVHPREVFRSAIREAATAVVCVHNHPSGDPAPSSADLQVTRRLREAALAVDIELVDHLILGTKVADPAGRGYYSFREAGLL
ncbi:MAG TPA: DNA repair protein RadC [Opitutaceae bacterium]|nr:DNA repair protein RadC [Opitutaceae bacterium]